MHGVQSIHVFIHEIRGKAFSAIVLPMLGIFSKFAISVIADTIKMRKSDEERLGLSTWSMHLPASTAINLMKSNTGKCLHVPLWDRAYSPCPKMEEATFQGEGFFSFCRNFIPPPPADPPQATPISQRLAPSSKLRILSSFLEQIESKLSSAN